MSGSVAIVGGGVAGLIAAIDLAREGLEVRVFEAASELGGRARTHHINGYAFNQGAHALYVEGAFRAALWRLGVGAPGGGPKLNQAFAFHRNRFARLPTSIGSLAATRLLSVSDKLAFGRIQSAIRDGDRPAGSFADWLDRQPLSMPLRQTIEAVARLSTYAHAPAEMSAAAVLDQLKIAFGGVIYVDGGWATLIDGLAAKAKEAGAVIETGVSVSQVTPEAAGVRLTLADGETLNAEAVLLAVEPEQAARLRPSACLQEAARCAVPARANTLDLGLEALPEGAKMFVLGVDRPLYFSVHSLGGRLAPSGGALVHLARYLGPGEKPSRDAIAELEAFADVVMPGWRPLERQRRRLIDMPVVTAVPRWDMKRPGVQLSDTSGVFIAGDWVGDKGMLSDASAASAQDAAKAIRAFLSAKTRRAAA